MYARGMKVREIQGHLQELYEIEVSSDLISTVTDAVVEEVREWQNRPLDSIYPGTIFGAPRVKIRDEGVVKNKMVYVALRDNMHVCVRPSREWKLALAQFGILFPERLAAIA